MDKKMLQDDGDIAAKISWSVLALDAFLVVPLFGAWIMPPHLGPSYGRYDSSSSIGWFSILIAVIAFGFTEVPLKMPAAKTQGPGLFNAYTCVGNALSNCAFLLFCCGNWGFSFQWQWSGCCAALSLMIVQAFARNAVKHLGISAAALWCSIGMVTSFVWGTKVFGDSPHDLWLALAGLAVLMLAVLLLSFGWIVDKTSEQRTNEAAGLLEQVPLLARAGGLSTLKGIAFAAGAGVADGSLVAYYQNLENSMWSPAIMFSYFGSFGATMLVCGVSLWAGVALTCESKPSTVLSEAVPGMISGAMWAMGNACSVLASHFLGMSLSFPLTQTACAIGAALGIAVFGEITSFRGKLCFTAGLSVGICGVALLSIFGQSPQMTVT